MDTPFGHAVADDGLMDAYDQAWAEWESSDHEAAWQVVTADGLDLDAVEPA